ncbi:flavodoxin family protein [Clostridium sp. AWRP]|uniref:flavodoxin family protein n=1 Tax=Clostridium sp. AWRP TaxID=2212991 RepID=UPI000FD9CB62|nr:flavodoxin family protein [Clostridium sp. AWRP]AZV56571.1 flavodoxin family protein [Clostridium sp. AWRP]
MKVLALNGSPRGEQGNTEVILENFLKGCSKAGADVETIYLKDKKINHCSGCFTCWTKTPGKCVYKDDMSELLDKIKETDVMVYATPLYYFTVTGIMKDFMDRMLPMNKGEIVKKDEKYSHIRRFRKEPVKTVLISNCGFPGRYNFSGLLETFKVMTKGNLAATILSDKGGVLAASKDNDMLKKLYEPFFEAVEKAGEEVINCGYIKDDTQAILDRDVIDTEMYLKNANKNWNE